MAAVTGPDVATARAQVQPHVRVQLASVGSPMRSPFVDDCPTLVCTDLIGANAGTPTPGPLFAAMLAPGDTAAIASSVTDPISALISVFVSNGTAEHPNAGWFIGNGFAGAAGQSGGTGGLLIGNGGVGAAGVNGGAGRAGTNAVNLTPPTDTAATGTNVGKLNGSGAPAVNAGPGDDGAPDQNGGAGGDIDAANGFNSVGGNAGDGGKGGTGGGAGGNGGPARSEEPAAPAATSAH
jgi:hypothetical protein